MNIIPIVKNLEEAKEYILLGGGLHPKQLAGSIELSGEAESYIAELFRQRLTVELHGIYDGRRVRAVSITPRGRLLHRPRKSLARRPRRRKYSLGLVFRMAKTSTKIRSLIKPVLKASMRDLHERIKAHAEYRKQVTSKKKDGK